MRRKLGTALLAIVATVALGSAAQAASINSILYGLAATNGYLNTPARYDFNDLSASTEINNGTTLGALEVGDILRGGFIIGELSLATTAGAFVDSVNLPTTDVQVTGVFELEVIGIGGLGQISFGAVSSGNLLPAGTMFQIWEDSRTSGTVASLGSKTGATVFADTAFKDGTLYASLGVSGGGTYTVQPLTATQAAVLPNLDILAAPVGTGINSPQLQVAGRVGGTGTIDAVVGTPGEFTDRASFYVSATVIPIPQAVVAGLPLMGILAMARRRRLSRLRVF